MGEQAALAHADGVGKAAERQPLEALDGREPRGLAQNRLAASLAVAAAPALRVSGSSSLDKLARSVVLYSLFQHERSC